MRAAAEEEHKKVPRAAVAMIGNEPTNDCEAINPPVMAVEVTKPVSRILLSLAYCFNLESIIRFCVVVDAAWMSFSQISDDDILSVVAEVTGLLFVGVVALA